MCAQIDEATQKTIKDKHFKSKMNVISFKMEICLKLFIKSDPIEEYFCDGCNTKTTADCVNEIAHLPKILVIHIKRFIDTTTKRNNLIDFPFNLDMEPLVNKNVNIVTNTKYKLCSVINHTGTLQYGHYYTYGYDKVNDCWLKFDDTNVTVIPETKIVSAKAYMLFYELCE
jgi:ubiquitin C-terminal hydrolase